MKYTNRRIVSSFITILFIIVILCVPFDVQFGAPFDTLFALAADTLTLTLHTDTKSVTVGDNIIFTIKLSDATATNLCAFAFRIVLPDGLEFKPNSGGITSEFKKSSGMVTIEFDEAPYLIVSGFGDGSYNGGAIDIASFTCIAKNAGTMNVNLEEVEMVNSLFKIIPTSVSSARVVVLDTGSSNVQKPTDSNTGDNNPPATTPPANSVGGNSQDPVDWTNPFADVNSSNWFFEYVAWVYTNNLMGGTSPASFMPNAPMTRSMLVTVLHRHAGLPSSGKPNLFKDVPNGGWYTDAVSWGAENEIVSGTSSVEFSPNRNITREQLVTMLYRYALYCGLDVSAQSNLNSFPDAATIADYAIIPMCWAVEMQIITGRTGGVLDPKSPASRAEVAAILQRYSAIS